MVTARTDIMGTPTATMDTVLTLIMDTVRTDTTGDTTAVIVHIGVAIGDVTGGAIGDVGIISEPRLPTPRVAVGPNREGSPEGHTALPTGEPWTAHHVATSARPTRINSGGLSV
jgi:hypothetical protein